jgi:serine/tyrosine/threonine adenylyltransferase
VLHFDNTFATQLSDLGTPCNAARVPMPRLAVLNEQLANALGCSAAELKAPEGIEILSGNVVPEGASPFAQVYAGHQFGGFSPQLGDGRALLLGEVIAIDGTRFDLAFKGSGRTPYSRGGDGKAAVGPALREYIMGEAMHALGVPTTRVLSVATTGEMIQRDTMLPGAILTRVAASHVRVGTFEYFASRGDIDKLTRLTDYVIARHYPDLASKPDRAMLLLHRLIERQAQLIARWMHVGFIHGVMNTDNMTLSGETIDYGPCAFMEAYDPAAVFSSIDHNGRYAYAKQPSIAQWNIARFAEALLPLIAPHDPEQAIAPATEAIKSFIPVYERFWLQGMLAKMGLTGADAKDAPLAHTWLTLLHQNQVDYTTAFCSLTEAMLGHDAALRALFPDGLPALCEWLAEWHKRSEAEPESREVRAANMRKCNPVYIPRNHLVEEALVRASEHGDFSAAERLVAVITRPFSEDASLLAYATPAPAAVTASYRTFCGT